MIRTASTAKGSKKKIVESRIARTRIPGSPKLRINRKKASRKSVMFVH
jgi:hypothetical protein